MRLDGGRHGRKLTIADRPDLVGKGFRGLRRGGRVLVASVWLVRAARGVAETELWFGDSHSIFLNQAYTSSVLSRAPGGQLVWHLGPRLMWTLANKPMPFPVRAVAWLLRTFGRRGSIVPVFIAGEIDVRCHLVPQSRRPEFNFDFVPRYVERMRAFAASMGAPRLVIVAPVPPSDCPENSMFPIKGTIEQRVTAFEQLRSALSDATAAVDAHGPAVRLVDPTPLLADETGALDGRLTDDGCHTNAAGRQLVRMHFGAL